MQQRHTLNIDADLLRRVKESRPGVTTTALVEAALRTLLALDAAERLASMEGAAPEYQRPRRVAGHTT